MGDDYFFENFYDIYLNLLKDSKEEIRVKIALDFHNVINSLGKCLIKKCL